MEAHVILDNQYLEIEGTKISQNMILKAVSG